MSDPLSAKGKYPLLKFNIRKVNESLSFRSVNTRILRSMLVIAGFIVLCVQVYAINSVPPRSKFETDIGFGFPESICLKAKYGDIVQAGIMQGFDSRGPGATGFEIYGRVGKKPRLLDQKPWYIMGGLAGYIFNVPYAKEYKLLLYPRGGRSIYFSKKVGINLDLGLGFPFGRDTSLASPISPVLLSGSMNLFIRF
jgi:hypothetical protein